MSQFNSFENAIDFSFWREICEEYGTRRSYCRGDYFTHTGTMLQEVGWIVSGGFKHSLIDNAGNIKAVGFVFDGSVLGNYQSVMLGRPMQTDTPFLHAKKTPAIRQMSFNQYCYILFFLIPISCCFVVYIKRYCFSK